MTVTKDKVVSIKFILTDGKNNVLDGDILSSLPSVKYLHGHNNIIPGLEKALDGKSQGERFTVTIPCAEAYGERHEELVMDVPRDRFKEVEPLEAGNQFPMQTDEGLLVITIVKVKKNTVTVDGNPPLAGKDLTYDVTITEIRDASEEELRIGNVRFPFPISCGDDCDCGDNCDCGGDCCRH